MTRNGKIARLPKAVREELNRRLDEGEQGKELLGWLNSLAETKKLLASDFGGRAINEQNLCEWRKRGYRDWQMKLERTEMVRQLEEEGEDLGKTANPECVSRRLSMVLMSELAQALRDAKEQVSDPKEWVEALGRLAGRFAQLQREESNATRAGISKEKWDRQVDEEEHKKWLDTLSMPRRAYELQRMYIEAFPEEDDGTFEDSDGEPIGGLFSVGVRVRARPERRWKGDSPKSKVQGPKSGTVPEPAGGDPSSPGYDATSACGTGESKPIKVNQSESKSSGARVERKQEQAAAEGKVQVAEGTEGTKGTKEVNAKEITESKLIKPDQSESKGQGSGVEGKQDNAPPSG